MRRLLIGIVCLVSPLALFSQAGLRGGMGLKQDANLQLQKFSEFFIYLNGSYIDTVNNEQVVEKAIEDILAELDPHSSYLSPKDMVEFDESFEGKFEGIGVQINMLNDTIRVAGVITGGPSEKVEILPNDRIIAIEGESIIGMIQTNVVKRLRGPKGTPVNIEVVRFGEKKPLHFRIIRDEISIFTIDASYMVDNTTGYIRVNRFAHTTMEEFLDAYDKLDNPQSMILDLRSNGGGLLNQAIDMANFFLPKGSLITSTEGRLVPSEKFTARREGSFLKGKVVVLIDDFSASASEIVSGALQDWDRAVIIGRRSFGKGLVQRQFRLIDGSAVNITVSRYLTPTGRAIQRAFQKGKGEEYYEEFTKRFVAGYTDSLPGYDSLRYQTLRLGKNVYGGGGIFPDYYVPTDSTGVTDYMSALTRKGVVYEYANSYMDEHRTELLETYKDLETFKKGYNVTREMLSAMAELGVKREVPRNDTELETSGELISLRLKAYIARSLWGDAALYEISNEDDPVMEKAMEVIRDWDKMARGIATDGI